MTSSLGNTLNILTFYYFSLWVTLLNRYFLLLPQYFLNMRRSFAEYFINIGGMNDEFVS